jgi:ribosomal protein S18 acetylase RimI-like enzyme
MTVYTREMTIDDYDEVFDLWQVSEGVGLSTADERDEIDMYLRRNPGTSFVALDEGQLVAAVLCGHDGRRGYIHHLAVKKSHRQSGIGRRLVENCLGELQLKGIQKCHLFVFGENRDAIVFWERLGFIQRLELRMMSSLT